MSQKLLELFLAGLLISACKPTTPTSTMKDDDLPAGPTSSGADAAKGGVEQKGPDPTGAGADNGSTSGVTLDLEECADSTCGSSVPLDLSKLIADNSGGASLPGTDADQAMALADTITKGLTVSGTVFEQIGASVDVDALAKATVGASFTGQASLTGNVTVTRPGTVDQLPAFVTDSTVKQGDTLSVSIGFGVQGTFSATGTAGVSIVVAKASVTGTKGLVLGATFTAGYTRDVTAAEDGKTVVSLLASDMSKLQGAVAQAAQKWFTDNAQAIKDALQSQAAAVRASAAAAADAGRGAGNTVYSDLHGFLTWKACYKYDTGWGLSGEGQQGCTNAANSQAPDNFDAFYNACAARVDELCKS